MNRLASLGVAILATVLSAGVVGAAAIDQGLFSDSSTNHSPSTDDVSQSRQLQVPAPAGLVASGETVVAFGFDDEHAGDSDDGYRDDDDEWDDDHDDDERDDDRDEHDRDDNHDDDEHDDDRDEHDRDDDDWDNDDD